MTQRTLYTLGDSPPGRSVQMALEYLELSYENKQVDFDNGEHYSKEYLEMYPQGELPVLNDFGFVIGESVAIVQYLASKYPRDEIFYPRDAERNSVVHHRLAFYLSTYYRRIQDYYIMPMDYDYKRTEENLKKLNHALRVFNELLRKQNTAYVAGDKLTIADIPLMVGTAVIVALKHDLEPFPYIKKWFQTFREEQPKLWPHVQALLDGFEYYEANPRDMSHLRHPIHPSKPSKQ